MKERIIRYFIMGRFQKDFFGFVSPVAKIIFITLLMTLDRLMGRKIVVIDISNEGFVQFIYPIYEQLYKYKRPIAYYLALKYPMKNELSKFRVSLLRQFPSSIAKHFFMTDIFIESEIYCRGPKNSIKIMVGHGQPNKFSNWAEENLKAFDVYFLYGPLLRDLFEMIKTEKPQSTSHIELMNIGYPKIDDLFQLKYKREVVLSDLGLNPALPTILYAPAWDPGGSLRTYGIQVIESLLAIPDVNVVVKLHPISLGRPQDPHYEFYTGGVDWIDRFRPFEKHTSFCHVTNYSINPILAAADVMVTDFSGVALEFMTQDRPVVYIDCPEFYEKTLKEWGQDPELSKNDERLNAGRNVGVVVKDISKLSDVVMDSLRNPAALSAKRKALMERFLYNPGRGAATAAEAVLKLLSLQ